MAQPAAGARACPASQLGGRRRGVGGHLLGPAAHTQGWQQHKMVLEQFQRASASFSNGMAPMQSWQGEQYTGACWWLALCSTPCTAQCVLGGRTCCKCPTLALEAHLDHERSPELGIFTPSVLHSAHPSDHTSPGLARQTVYVASPIYGSSARQQGKKAAGDRNRGTDHACFFILAASCLPL